MESVDPRRYAERMETELPQCNQSNTDIPDPSCDTPNTLRLLPSLPNDLKLKEDPRWNASKTEQELPILASP
jgi:hypothetical protein